MLGINFLGMFFIKGGKVFPSTNVNFEYSVYPV